MANNRRITIDIEANDYASSVFRNVTANIGNFGSRANSAVHTANDALRRYNNSMQGFNRTVQRALLEAGRAIYSFTSDAIKQFAKLEEQHAKTMGAMASNYDFSNPADVTRFQTNSNALMNQAIQYGYNGPSGQGSLYSPYEISTAQTALKKAGISEEDILNTNALSNVIKFAGGAGIDLDSAVEFAVQLGAQFNYTPDMWGDMLDQVVYAANASIIDVEDIMASMKYAGNMASGYDIPLADVLAALDVMGQSGLKGSQAGTGIQAIFARGMSPTGISTAGAPPTENVEEIYNGFVSKVVDAEGNFKGLGNFTDVLEESTFDLSDQEKAWFYKKLFGMFQQKAGLALTGADPEKGEMTYQDYVDAIIEHAAGTNDKIYEVALDTTYGSLESVENAWLAFKTEFGKDLSPITKSVARQLRNAMVNKDYNFDTDDIRQAVEEAGQLISADFGEQLGNAVVEAGNLLADAIDVGSAETPMLTGAFDALVKLLNGDVSGAFSALKQGVDDTNENIDDLPPELQETAKAIRNLILIFEGLFALNIVTRVGQFILTIGTLVGDLGGGIGKFVSWITGKTNNSLNSTVTSTNANLTTNSVGSMYVSGNVMTMNVNSIPALTASNVANATIASMMANTTTMTVYASVVNVIGGSGLGNGGSGLGGGGGTPILGGGGGTPALGGGGSLPSLGSGLLPTLAAGGGGLAIGSGWNIFTSGQAALPGASSTLGLPGDVILDGAATAGASAAAGSAVNLYFNPITGSYMTAGELAGSIGLTALKAAPSIAALALLTTAPSAQSQTATAYQYGFGTDYATYLGADYKNIDSVSQFLHDMFGPAGGSWRDDMSNSKMQDFIKDKVNPATPTEYRIARDDLFNAIDGLKDYSIGKEFLSGIMDRWYYDNSGGDTNFITQDQYVALATALANAMGDYLAEHPEWTDSGYANGVPGYGTDIYQTILDAMLEGLSNEQAETDAANAQATQDNTAAMISLSDAIATLSQNKSFVLGLGQGPLSEQGAYDYMMSAISGANGASANQELVNKIVGGIQSIDPTINIDVQNPAPKVNVDVKVNVDKSGNVTKQVIMNYSDFSNWVLRDAARFGGTTATSR